MSVQVLALIEGKYVENATTVQYTSTNIKTVITSFSVKNTTASPVTFTAYLVKTGDSVGNSNMRINLTLAANEHFLGFGIVGQVLNMGTALVTNCGTANALSLYVSGSQIT